MPVACPAAHQDQKIEAEKSGSLSSHKAVHDENKTHQDQKIKAVGMKISIGNVPAKIPFPARGVLAHIALCDVVEIGLARHRDSQERVEGEESLVVPASRRIERIAQGGGLPRSLPRRASEARLGRDRGSPLPR